MKIRSKLLVITIALMAAASGPLSAAQSGQSPVEQTNQSSYSDAELKIFAEALLEVERINSVYQPSLDVAKTPEEENQVQQAAFNEVTKAFERKGISVDKYKEILIVAKNNPDVAERIRQHVRNIM